MNNPAIRVRHLSKQYVIGSASHYSGSVRESLSAALRAPVRSLRARRKPTSQPIWALQDVSFDVQLGEVVGIIGHNGAGKTTLLKILSRITEPTSGGAELRGRVGALLEVGTGFHPELTGRENIFLNGAILGMRRQEILRKFKDIVEFSGVEKFIDTPVKRYSTGMHVRLAFAVAAHFEPEIMIVDEVLAVGDAAFQRKCLGRMGNAAREGRTVLFVSHNMSAVRALCKRGIQLDGGRIVFDGDVTSAIEHYLTSTQPLEGGADLRNTRGSRQGDGKVRMAKVNLEGGAGPGLVRLHEPLTIAIEFDVIKPIRDVVFGFSVYSVDESPVLQSLTTSSYSPIREIEPGTYFLEGRIETNILAPGRYWIELGARDAQAQQDLVPRAMEFEVVEIDEALESPWFGHTSGYVRVPVDWSEPVSVDPTKSD